MVLSLYHGCRGIQELDGKETIMGISDRDIHYSSHIYPIDHPKIKRLMDSHPQLCQGILELKQ